MITSSFWLDDYNDIYSDFDSRHYQLRRISEDFLHELRMDMRYQQEPIEELTLLVPEPKREEATEAVISNSLKKFFQTQYQLCRGKCRRKLNTSILLGTIGIVIMMLDATAIFLGIRSLATTLLSTIMEPASWFLLWTSVDYLIYDWNNLRKERHFYKKLSEANIAFKTA
ncbi:MAG: hypothetical protein WC756_13240 [Taibaiella sp.]|jgi:hypothetical protein